MMKSTKQPLFEGFFEQNISPVDNETLSSI
jgi:hypothetical protein